VGGCDIVPVAAYAVRASVDGIYLSDAWLDIETIEKPGATRYWADIIGYFNGVEWTAPNGEVNFDDVVAAVKYFESDPYKPHLTCVDLDAQYPNKVLNFADVFNIVLAFQGAEYPFGCFFDDPCADRASCPPAGAAGGAMGPMGGGGFPMGGGSPVAFSLVPDRELIGQGETVDVEVYIDSVDDLGAYEVSLEVTGGDTGSLNLEDLVIDKARPDYVFGTEDVVDAVDMVGERLGACLMDGGMMVQGPAYLGTFTYRASQDASGVFQVTVRPGIHSFLKDSSAETIESSPGDGTLVGCEVECTVDGHCDDSNPCTDDTCDSGVCVFTNDDNNTCTDENQCTDDWCESGVCESTPEPAGTPCNDGLFCTAVDECDGNGSCVGNGDPSSPGCG
jgi:hypothetical protein